MSMERILTEQRNARDLLLSGHPEQHGLRMAIADLVAEEILQGPDYAEFLSRKRFLHQDSGFECGELNNHLFDWLQACQNLAIAEREARPMELFA